MNYACDFSQSEMEKYSEWIIIYLHRSVYHSQFSKPVKFWI